MTEPKKCGWWNLDDDEFVQCTSGKPADFVNCGWMPAMEVCEDHKCRCLKKQPTHEFWRTG